MKIISLILLLLTTSFTYADSNSKVWRINPDHSEVLFNVSYLSLSKVSGRFSKFKGRVHFDEDVSLITTIKIDIQSDSLFTGQKRRDNHIKSDDFFKAKKFPMIRFSSQKIKPIGPDQFLTEGVLSLGGVEKTMSMKFKLIEGGLDTWGYENKFVTFSGEIDRREFGIKWNKSLKDNKHLVGNIVNISGSFQLQPLRFKTPTSKFFVPNTKYIKLRDQLKRGEISQEEFDSLMAPSEKRVAIKENTKAVTKEKKVEEVIIKEPAYDKSFRDSAIWWASYLIMGGIGFIAAILICFQGKFIFMRFWPEKYEETGWLGAISDFFVYPIFVAYLWAMWNLGYA